MNARDEAMTAREEFITGHGGDQVLAYVARPPQVETALRGGVMVLHHMPGWDPATKEITRRFAAHGYLAICPNLHYREAPGASPDDSIRAAYRIALGRPPDDAERADALAFLASQQERHRAEGAADSRAAALADFCQVLFGLNEFVFIE